MTRRTHVCVWSVNVKASRFVQGLEDNVQKRLGMDYRVDPLWSISDKLVNCQMTFEEAGVCRETLAHATI